MNDRVILFFLLLLITPASAETIVIGKTDGKNWVTVRVDESTGSKQHLPIFPGISKKTAGAKGISLLKVVIPPGATSEPHTHKGHESAIYVLQGRAETRYGKNLEHSVINIAGDYIYVPADLPHQAINLSDTEPVIAIVARNDGEEQEHVLLIPQKRSSTINK